MNAAIMVGIGLLLVSAILVYSMSEKTPSTKGGSENSFIKKWLKTEWQGCKDIFNAFLPAVLMIGLTILVVWFLLDHGAVGHSAKQYHVRLPQEVAAQGQLPLIKGSSSASVKNGKLTWYIQEGSGAVSKHCARVIVNEMNSQLMDFTVISGEDQKARFVWNKANGSYGNWTQNYPQDGGQWYLKRKSSKIFAGEQSDNTGIFIPMILEL